MSSSVKSFWEYCTELAAPSVVAMEAPVVAMEALTLTPPIAAAAVLPPAEALEAAAVEYPLPPFSEDSDLDVVT